MKTSAKERAQVHDSLARLGVSYCHADKLRRISLTLHRWAELECGDGNDFASWGIERDETTFAPYFVTYPHQGKPRRRRIADRERGALRRLNQIMAEYPALVPYHQGDPRGASLYIVPKERIGAGESLDSVYTRGVAVY